MGKDKKDDVTPDALGGDTLFDESSSMEEGTRSESESDASITTAEVSRASSTGDFFDRASEKVDNTGARAFAPLRIFSESYYDDVDVPDEAIKFDDDGNPSITPIVDAPWKCRYFYSPYHKARLARHSGYAIFMMIAGAGSAFQQAAGGISAVVLAFLLLINFQFRYRDIALYKIPMPSIPILSDIDFGEAFRSLMEEDEDRDEDDEDAEEYKEIAEQESSITFVEPVNDVVDGNSSPATILTRWMNNVASMTTGDFIDESDGKLNNLTMTMLLTDNSGVWADDDILDIVSQITQSHPQQWREAYEAWDNAKQPEE